MLVYPQLATGTLSQFPVLKRRSLRTIVNTAADGTAVKLADPGAETVEWQLNYVGLSDVELAALLQFYSAAEGTLNSFTFLDPTANLLAWSNDLSNAVWNNGPLLTNTAGNADPAGGNNAWHAVNAGAGAQDLTQTLSTAPGGYVYCFSVYAKSAAPTTVTLLLGSNRYAQLLGPDWRRIACTGTGGATASSMTFGIELGAGAAVDLYGWQAEPQASPSLYKASTSGGCYEEARLRDDMLSFTTTDVNRHSATVNIIHASHL
jgi:hypothetical protein